MLEIGLIILSVVVMYKIGDTDEKSGASWAGITAGLCIGSLFIVPLPFLRVVIITVGMLIAMTIYRAIKMS